MTSALGHEQTSRHVRVMSVIPLKADIHHRGLHVRLVPKAGDKGALASYSTSALDNGAYAEGGATKLSEAELCHNAKSIRYVREGGLFGITNLNSSDP